MLVDYETLPELVECEGCGRKYYRANVAFYLADDGRTVCTFCYGGPTFAGDHARTAGAVIEGE